MRWNETCVLVAKSYEPDGEGVPQPTDTKTEVFCNVRHAGAASWYSMHEMGISIDAHLEVRTCDYNGERDVEHRGKWYSVEEIDERGDITILMLRHQQSDSDDSPEAEEPGEPEEGGLSA